MNKVLVVLAAPYCAIQLGLPAYFSVVSVALTHVLNRSCHRCSLLRDLLSFADIVIGVLSEQWCVILTLLLHTVLRKTHVVYNEHGLCYDHLQL